MKKSTKGALAASAAGVLLLGGAGSLAFWSATDTVSGIGVTAGELKLSAANCTGWKFDGSETTPNKAYVPATDKIVPGDVLTQSCDYTITAKGEHLRATITTASGASSGPLNDYLTTPFPTLTYKTPGPNSAAVAGAPVGNITEAADGSVITAKLSLAFNSGAPNASQDDGTGAMFGGAGDFTVTFDQIHAP
jgi:alternate signal-mediated exported protein